MDVIIIIIHILIVVVVCVALFLAGGIFFLKRAERYENNIDGDPSYTYHIIININANNQATYASNRRTITNIIDQICSPMNVSSRISASLLWDQSEEASVIFSEDMCINLYCSSETEFYDIYHRIRSRCEKYALQLYYGEGLR